jgi:hypothetical protein
LLSSANSPLPEEEKHEGFSQYSNKDKRYNLLLFHPSQYLTLSHGYTDQRVLN